MSAGKYKIPSWIIPTRLSMLLSCQHHAMWPVTGFNQHHLRENSDALRTVYLHGTWKTRGRSTIMIHSGENTSGSELRKDSSI